MSGWTVRRLGVEDLLALVTLRREALVGAPLSFGSSPADDVGLDAEFQRKALGRVDEQAVFGAFEGERLVGMVVAVRPTKLKIRHRVGIYGMYVSPTARSKGIGRALIRAAIEQARAWQDVEQVGLSVTTAAPEAATLYESEEFREWGREPRSLCHEGEYVDERHLVLELAVSLGSEKPVPG